MVIGLVAGKILGIFAGTYLAVRFTRAQLNRGRIWLPCGDVWLSTALTPGLIHD